ncbi:hypothetical protein PTKIN_Ptkin10aG0020900 [Pterospermum kingtungense]
MDSPSPALKLLVGCAKALDDGDLQHADDLLKQIWNLADHESNLEQSKVVKYYAEALVRRGYQLHSANSFITFHLSPPSFLGYFPDEFKHAIDHGKKRLHLIDFYLPNSFRLKGIIEAFNAVRVSVILPPSLKNILYVRKKIKKFITEYDEIELKEVYANNLGEVDVSILDLERRGDEAVMVLYSCKLHKLMAEPGAIERELSKLRGIIKPDIVIVEEVDANHNDSNFVVRLNNSFQYYYDASVANLLRTANYQRREIQNIVGCEGRDRIIRHHTLAQWRSRFLEAGFSPIPLTGKGKGKTYLAFRVEDGCLFITNRNRSAGFISAWKLIDSRDHFNIISNNFDQGFDPNLLIEDTVQPLQFDQKSPYLNRLAAFAEIYDMLEEVCLRDDLPMALTWACGANVNDIMSDPYKGHSLFIQSTFCYPYYDLRINKDEHQQMQIMAGKALRSSEQFHFEKNLPLSEYKYVDDCGYGDKYAYSYWFRDHAAVAICLQNYHNIDDVYVVEFFLPNVETELQEIRQCLALRIFNDLKNMKKKFVTVRSQLKGLNEQEGVIPNFHTPLLMSTPVLHEQGSGEQIPLQIVQKDVNNLLKKQSNKRRKSSSVWDEFTEKQVGVGNIRAICAHCKRDFDGSSKKGTTHLRNHLKICKRKATKIRDQQLTVPVGRGDSKNESAREGPSSFDPAKIVHSTTRDTNERNSMFDKERSRLDFARMIIKHQYPLDMAEQEYFRTFLKNLQPEFEFHPREIILADIDRIYAEEKEKLHLYFDQLACSFSLTISSCKENLGKNVYCCLIAQFIDDDWKLKKKILAFKSVEHMYDTGTLAGIIGGSISEWNMGSKVCSITVDDSCLSDDIVQQIKEYSSHCFISCSTLIRDGFREIDYLLWKLKKLIEYVSETAHGRLKFQEAVNQAKQQGGKSMDDLSSRLDSDFGILDSALKSREIFCQLEKIDGNFRVNPSIEEWEKAQALHGCLEGFHDILSSSKGTQSLTSNLYFAKLCDIYKKFVHLEKSNYPFVTLIKGKFDHFWSLCNLVFAVAAVLDPRLKFQFVEYSYNEIYGHGSESQLQLNIFHRYLRDVYNKYANKPKNCTASASAFGEFSSSTRQSTQIADGSILDSFSKFTSANNFNAVPSWKSEIDCYLDEPLLPLTGEAFFDILCWWRDNSERFPTVARMARDLLAIPLSVVPPCSDFSAMIINPAYRGLNPESMEALMCSQNWLEMPKGIGQPMFPDNKASRNDLASKATLWAQKDVRTYLVSPFTDFEHIMKSQWENLARSGDNVGPDKIPGKALAPLLKAPPHDNDLEDAQSYYIEDTVVNQYFVLLERRYKRFPHKYLKHYSFDSSTATFLIEGLKSEYGVLRPVNQNDLKGVRKVLLPMCLHGHWLLFVADIDDKKLLWLDSIEHSQMSNVSDKQIIQQWFLKYLLPSLGHDPKDWSFDVPKDIPLQKNSVDCALFVMKYADCLTHGNYFPFSQEDMPHFRYRTFLDLCLGSICSERSQDDRVNHAPLENMVGAYDKGDKCFTYY